MISMVKVWQASGNRLCTNEDGGAPISDEIYLGALWSGPIDPPSPPA
jgi:hypothetical protein